MWWHSRARQWRAFFSSLYGDLKIEAGAFLGTAVDLCARQDILGVQEFEFSLRLRGGVPQRAVRVVNYDNQSFKYPDLYAARIEMLRDILTRAKASPRALRFMDNASAFSVRVPMYLGIELNPQGKALCKIYCNVYGIASDALRRQVVRRMLEGVAAVPRMRAFPFSLFAVDCLPGSGALPCKIYYLHSFSEKRPLRRGGFSAQEIEGFQKLEPFAGLPYYVIAERVKGARVYSRKLEVGIRPDIDQRVFLAGLLAERGVRDAGGTAERILRTRQRCRTQLRVVIVEGGVRTVYVRVIREGRKADE